MKNIARILAILISFLAINCTALSLPKRPVLGLILPLSGKAALAGEAVKNAVEMANSDAGNFFDLRIEDNALDNANTVTSFRKLIEQDKIQAIIVYASGPAIVAAPLAEQAKIPMIAMSVDPAVSRGRDWVMIHWATNKNVTEALLTNAENRGLKRIALVNSETQGLTELREVFRSEAEKRGFSIVFDQSFLPNETDFRTVVTAIKAKAPDAIFLNLYYGQAGIFAQQASSQGMRPSYLSTFVLDNEKEIEAAQGALDGAIFANSASADKEFKDRYQRTVGKSPVVATLGAYDSTSLLISAFRTGGGDAEKSNAALHMMNKFSGKIGTYGSLPNNSFDVPVELKGISAGKIVSLP